MTSRIQYSFDLQEKVIEAYKYEESLKQKNTILRLKNNQKLLTIIDDMEGL